MNYLIYTIGRASKGNLFNITERIFNRQVSSDNLQHITLGKRNFRLLREVDDDDTLTLGVDIQRLLCRSEATAQGED